MKINNFKIIFIISLFVFLFSQKAYSKEENDLYYSAVKAARQGKIDFAFTYFDMLLKKFPDYRFAENALFAVGEYHFSVGDYRNAKKSFEKFIVDHPNSKGLLFAFFYLLKIAREENKETLIEELEKKIVSLKQVSLLFRDFKEYSYLSPLYKDYKAIHFIDRIEIYIDDDLFAEIHF